jgi:adenylosuccinate synthase
MAVDLLLGLQWEMKEKEDRWCSYLKLWYILLVFQGGLMWDTLEFDGIKHVLRTIPSGIFHKTAVKIVIGSSYRSCSFQKKSKDLRSLN